MNANDINPQQKEERMGMGAAENGAAWEAPKTLWRWVGTFRTFRGYAKKMLLAGGVWRRLWGKACTMQTWGTYSRSVTLRCMDSICRTLPSLTLWNT
jgi:hypothetical protein